MNLEGHLRHRIVYVLLSPTIGMHQYTADLANRIAPSTALQRSPAQEADSQVRVVTTTTAARDRYGPGVELVTPITTRGTGFSREGLDCVAYRHAVHAILAAVQPETIVHFTGVHLWNVLLVHALRRRGVRVIHTLHDLAPHSGVRRGGLIRLWNRLIIASGATILVHGRCYRAQLIGEGVGPEQVVYAPLLHGFWGWEMEERLRIEAEGLSLTGRLRTRESPVSNPESQVTVIFFGRLEAYKGVDTLLESWARLGMMQGGGPGFEDARLILAGQPGAGLTLPGATPRVELRDRHIGDDEALDLFRRAALLVLPYRDATQSALIAAAARLGVPSLVTRTGALPEYVIEGETGWVVPSEDPEALAAALAEALSDRTRLARMGTAAHSWYNDARAVENHILTQLYDDRT